jgi:hypothetical protein
MRMRQTCDLNQHRHLEDPAVIILIVVWVVARTNSLTALRELRFYKMQPGGRYLEHVPVPAPPSPSMPQLGLDNPAIQNSQ